MSLRARTTLFSLYQWSVAIATLVLLISIFTKQPVPAVLAWVYLVTSVYFYDAVYRKVQPNAHAVHPHYF